MPPAGAQRHWHRQRHWYGQRHWHRRPWTGARAPLQPLFGMGGRAVWTQRAALSKQASLCGGGRSHKATARQGGHCDMQRHRSARRPWPRLARRAHSAQPRGWRGRARAAAPAAPVGGGSGRGGGEEEWWVSMAGRGQGGGEGVASKRRWPVKGGGEEGGGVDGLRVRARPHRVLARQDAAAGEGERVGLDVGFPREDLGGEDDGRGVEDVLL